MPKIRKIKKGLYKIGKYHYTKTIKEARTISKRIYNKIRRKKT